MRTVPLSLEKTTLDPAEALKMCDENTICVVPIEGVTWTGLNDDVEALDKALDEFMPGPDMTYPSMSMQPAEVSFCLSLILTANGISGLMGTLNQHLGT